MRSPVTAYGTADGMNIRECSGGGHPAAWKLADGSLWFATLDGVSFIDPAHAPENRVPPPVAIEKVLVDDQARSLWTQELRHQAGRQPARVPIRGAELCGPAEGAIPLPAARASTTAGSRPAAGGPPFTPTCPRATTASGCWRPTMTGSGIPPAPPSACACCRIITRPGGFIRPWRWRWLLLGYLVYRWRVLQVEAQWGAVLRERGRIAREIHDTLAQGFVGISVQLELVARLLAGSREAAPKPAGASIRAAGPGARAGARQPGRCAHVDLGPAVGSRRALQTSPTTCPHVSAGAVPALPVAPPPRCTFR